MSGFVKRFVLSMVASKLQRASQKRHNPAIDGLLREVNHRIARSHGYGHHPGGYGHPGAYGHPGGYRQHGHYRQHHGHYRQHHGHYRRKFW